MSFYGATPFMAQFATERIVTITGGPGTYKTCMAMDLARPFLEEGYAFTNSVNTVWSDPEEYPLEEWVKDDPVSVRLAKTGIDVVKRAKDLGFPNMMPWVYRRVFVMDEGGRDLRVFAQFGDLSMLPRKFRDYIIISSKKPPHDDLAALMVLDLFLFESFIPGWRWGGGLYHWQYDQGARRPQNGQFLYIPESIGLFDTDDLAQDSRRAIIKFTEAISFRQKSYGRIGTEDGISSLAALEETSEMEQQQNIARKLASINLSILNQKRN